MPTPIDPQRLPTLKKAMEECGDADWWSQRQLADLYGVANSRMTTLIKTRFPEFPAAQRREDKTHWYPARAAIASMIAYMENTSREKQEQARRHSVIMGRISEDPDAAPAGATAAPPLPAAAPPPVERAPLNAGELDRLASAQTRMWKLRKDQGLYTLTADVQDVARNLNSMLTREIMNMPNYIDPNGEMLPAKRQDMVRRCRDTVLKLHDMLDRFLEDDDDAGRLSGTAGARGGSDRDHERGSLRRRARDLPSAA